MYSHRHSKMPVFQQTLQASQSYTVKTLRPEGMATHIYHQTIFHCQDKFDSSQLKKLV